MTNAESCRDPHASAAPASASGRRHLRRLLLAATAAGTLLATSVGATTHGLIDWQSGWGQLQTWWTGALPGLDRADEAAGPGLDSLALLGLSVAIALLKLQRRVPR